MEGPSNLKKAKRTYFCSAYPNEFLHAHGNPLDDFKSSGLT